MAQRKESPDFMEKYMRRAAGQPIDKQPTDAPQANHESTTDAPQRGAMSKYHIRMDPADWEALREHFAGLGLTVSAGIRSIIKRYMQDEGIR